MHVGSCRHNIFYVDGDPLEALLVEVGHQDGVPVGDDEEGAGVVVGLAGVVVRGEAVPGDAAAGVGALGVGAGLRAEAGRGALVDVFAVERVGVELLSAGAEAERPVGCLLAPVRAEAVLMLALRELATCT